MCCILNCMLMMVSMMVVSSRTVPFIPPNVKLACSNLISRETTTYMIPPQCSSVAVICYMATCPPQLTLRFDHVQSVCFGHPFYGLSSYSVSTSTGDILLSRGRRECIPELTNRNATLTFHGDLGQVVFFDLTSPHEEETISLQGHRASSLEEALALMNELSNTRTDSS